MALRAIILSPKAFQVSPFHHSHPLQGQWHLKGLFPFIFHPNFYLIMSFFKAGEVVCKRNGNELLYLGALHEYMYIQDMHAVDVIYFLIC